MDVVALIALVALPLTSVLTVSEALAGFSDPSVVLIAALFVVGEGLVRTGIANRIGDFLLHRWGGSEARFACAAYARGFVAPQYPSSGSGEDLRRASRSRRVKPPGPRL
jgi:di/tricarboxylate transporter